jgi:hypothetical protein
MNDFFSKLFGKLHQTAAIPHPDTLISVQDESDHTTRHQLVQMLVRALLRKHGIPAHWIELHILAVPGKKQGLGMYVHLVLKQWDSRLMNHAQAFQNSLQTEIKRYEPKCSEWLHGILWKLEMGAACPYTTLPDKPFWSAPAQPAGPMVVPVAPPLTHMAPLASAAAPAAAMATAMAAMAASAPEPEPVSGPPAKTAQEIEEHAKLERLFAVRDQEMIRKATYDEPAGFEDTQPLEDDENPRPERA